MVLIEISLDIFYSLKKILEVELYDDCDTEFGFIYLALYNIYTFIHSSQHSVRSIFFYTTFAFGDDLGVGFFVSDVSALGFTLDVIVTLLKLILL